MPAFALQLPEHFSIAELHEHLIRIEPVFAGHLLPGSDQLLRSINKLPAIKDARRYWANPRPFPTDGQLLILMLLITIHGANADRMLGLLQVLICSMALSEHETRLLHMSVTPLLPKAVA